MSGRACSFVKRVIQMRMQWWSASALPCWIVLFTSAIGVSEVAGQTHPEVSVLGIERTQVSRIEESQQALLDFRLNEAERMLQEILEEDDHAPYAYFLYSSIAFWRAMVEDVEPAYDRFYARSDTLMFRLETAEETRWKQLVLGETYLQRAVALGKTEHVLRAAWAGRQAYSTYTSLTEQYPEFYPAYYGMGVIHVLLGSLPDTYRWILARIGITGTVDGGLRELEKSAAHSAYNGPHAQATLAIIDLILNQEKQEGVRRIQKLHEAYPNSLMFAHLYGFGLYSIRKAEKAQQIFETALDKRDDPAYHFIDFITYYLADVHFVQNQFSQAERHYQDFLENYQGKALVALARLRCGLALEMQNRYGEAREFYRSVTSDRSFDSDEYARRTAAERLEGPMSKVERQLLRGSNYYEAEAYDTAVELLMPLYENQQLSDEKRAEAAYYLGRVRQAQDRPQDAMTFYGYAADEPGDRSEKWQPWGQFYIGTIYADRGETGKARALFNQVLSYDHEYSYKKALEQRVHTAMDQL